jgi:hypothetical protein
MAGLAKDASEYEEWVDEAKHLLSFSWCIGICD